MPVPGFQEMFLPFLKYLEDGETRRVRSISLHLADHFELTEEDRDDRVPSGSMTRLANRVGWARTHLSKAGLIEQVSRGHYRLSQEGRQVLAAPPPRLDLKYLDTIPQHRAWFHTPRTPKPEPVQRDPEEKPPNERIEEAYEEIKDSLASSLLDTMAEVDPFRFERLVVDLLFGMGYGGSREEAAQVTKKSNDEGIDGVINEDRLGLDVIYVQAKRWQSQVGRKEIQSFVGALAGKQANKGVFITTSDFAQTAVDYAESVNQKVILINGTRLAELMIEHNIGVSTERVIELKRIDSDYFED